ncbi:probable indole-3-pyruvate monooxygenase YUCCA10 [Solanum dulcamara]|uniref:probable indole-3-pyruvate monooxygenase YUCCA10 n=1 Tax=Solanum dulcamara TaxID=45834 RepID=UPI0024863523|nr:probable indole-3-pyruvate monooxygenase YUCCA10 [Solanum dulcamara]
MLRISTSLAFFNNEEKKWNDKSRKVASGEVELYACDFLVLATGENNEGHIPKLGGLENCKGEKIHSISKVIIDIFLRLRVKALLKFRGSRGMHMKFNFEGQPHFIGYLFSILIFLCVVHVVTREMVHIGMLLLDYLPISLVDIVIPKYAKFKLGNLAEFGIPQPEEGLFSVKISKGTSPVIDIGVIDKIKLG